MFASTRFLFVSALLLSAPAFAWSQKESLSDQTVEDIAKLARDSIVVVTTTDRNGKEAVMGAGFAIAKDLIATNLHVIGEARPVWVQTRDGERHEVTEVFASDRTLDLAIIRIDRDEALPVLNLAEGKLAVGEQVVAIGHPLGLENSVVAGVIAGEQRQGGMKLWQVAMPIEKGNSGGPLLDMNGNVHGVVAMKSRFKQSFGFAIKVEQLRKLYESPNPIKMEQWRTIGLIDSNRWDSIAGARWRQRGGQLRVEGAGSGFGGRALLLRKNVKPKLPFEIAVSVKLDDEAGAAGLVFHSDDGDKHYGFYPSTGNLRLTSFEGPSVFTWTVVSEIQTDYYRPGDWNEIKVRVEKAKITGYVNGHEVVSVDEVRQPPGSIGLCKFRDTSAGFKHFRYGPTVPSRFPSDERIIELTKQLESLNTRSELLDIDLVGHSEDASQRVELLEQQARDLETRAKQLRRIGRDIHISAVCNEITSSVAEANVEDAEIDLVRGALLIAKLDNQDLDVDAYIQRVDEMSNVVRKRFTDEMNQTEKLEKLDEYLFEQNGFHGSRIDYYSEANSYLDRVIDDREGIPITLSVIYMSLANRLGLNVVGVGLPGHFVVRHEPTDEADGHQLIDVFDRGKRLSRNQANVLIFQMTGQPPRKSSFETAKNREILTRMLVNLTTLAENKPAPLLRYVEGLVAIEPDSPTWRGTRGVLRHQMGRVKAALDDLDWILETKPDGINLEEVRQMRAAFAKP